VRSSSGRRTNSQTDSRKGDERNEPRGTPIRGRADARSYLEGRGAPGHLGIAFAVVILIWPSIGLSTLIALFGAFALVSGVSTIVGAFRLPIQRGRRAWLVVDGLLGVAVGVVVFVWPGLSALGLLYAIAAWSIAFGVFEFGLAFSLALSGRRQLLLAPSGLLSAAFGVISSPIPARELSPCWRSSRPSRS
jgi:uncharacterized membrane protein HdeD (DUF308 family)